MLINKTYIFRMYPSDEQKRLINQTIGSSRFIYNYFLSQKINEYKNTKKSKSAYKQCQYLKGMYDEYPWLKEVDSCALRNSSKTRDDAYQRFFKSGCYSNFKNKKINGSYKTNCIRSSYKETSYANIEVDLNKRIKNYQN